MGLDGSHAPLPSNVPEPLRSAPAWILRCADPPTASYPHLVLIGEHDRHYVRGVRLVAWVVRSGLHRRAVIVDFRKHLYSVDFDIDEIVFAMRIVGGRKRAEGLHGMVLSECHDAGSEEQASPALRVETEGVVQEPDLIRALCAIPPSACRPLLLQLAGDCRAGASQIDVTLAPISRVVLAADVVLPFNAPEIPSPWSVSMLRALEKKVACNLIQMLERLQRGAQSVTVATR